MKVVKDTPKEEKIEAHPLTMLTLPFITPIITVLNAITDAFLTHTLAAVGTAKVSLVARFYLTHKYSLLVTSTEVPSELPKLRRVEAYITALLIYIITCNRSKCQVNYR